MHVLVRMAERGQLLALKCEMPQCYHHKGRGDFDPVGTPGNKWTPSRDHYPILKSAGGKLVAENVRLSHSGATSGTRRRRAQIRTLLAKASPSPTSPRPEPQGCSPGTRHEPMDGRHGAQGLRVLVRVRRWVPLCAKGEVPRAALGRQGFQWLLGFPTIPTVVACAVCGHGCALRASDRSGGEIPRHNHRHCFAGRTSSQLQRGHDPGRTEE